MSISEKLDAVVTTDTLNRIGEATVKAFGSATELAKAGAECTVNYVWASALVWLIAGLIVLFVGFICVGFAIKIADSEFSSGLLVLALFCLVFFIATLVSNTSTIIEPRGAIIYETIAPKRF